MTTTNKSTASILMIAAIIFLGGCKGGMLNSDGPDQASVTAPVSGAPKPKSSPLQVGERAPDFEAQDQLERLVSSAELTSGKGTAILIVPPADTAAARPAYQWASRNYLLLQQRGIELALLVPESPTRASEVAAQEGLRLALLSDPGSHIARGFGTVTKGGKSPSRPHIFFVGPDSRIHYSQPGTGDSAQLLLAAESLPGTPRGSAVPLF